MKFKTRLLFFLAWIGLTRRRYDGTWFVPFSGPGVWMFRRGKNGKIANAWRAFARLEGWKPYIFRNRSCNPWFHNDRGHNRLLPFRWGVGWAGFEFGDRGGEHVPFAPFHDYENQS